MDIITTAEIYDPVSLEEPHDDDIQNSEEPPSKRRRKKSIVWEHFTIESAGPSRMKACCKHCNKSFAYINGPKLAGTSHLKRHISLGICSGGVPKIETTPNTSGTKSNAPKRRYRINAAYAGIPFDQDRCTRDIANMIIQHDYPLHIVEHPGFLDFVRTLHPQYNMVSFNTIQGECVALYLREKQRLLEHISEIPGRVNLTLDLATSNLSIGYAFLTGHFINSGWKLERRILNVIMLPFPDSDYAFNEAVISCISDWHLENKLFTITLDKSYSNETIMGNLRGLLPVKNSLLLNGQMLKGSCYARLLSQLAQDAMARVQEPIKRIRESVKYVKTSETHEEKFAELRQQLQVPSTQELVVDDLTKWNTTYQMLAAACELKEVFGCLDTADPVYKINPSDDDWKQVEVLCTFLKLFFEAASILTAPVYPPANAFYHEVSKIQLELSVAAMNQDAFVSGLTKPLKEKFDEYWRESFLVLAIAVVMDPRFKMKLVEFSFSKIFGENAGSWIKSVDDGIHELFLDYIAPPPANLMIHANTHASQQDHSEDVLLPQLDGPSHGFSSLEDQSLHMHDNSNLNHSDAPQEVAFVPEIGGPSEEFSSLEGQSQGMPCEELQPEEKKPQELHPQGLLSQEVVHHETAYPEETRTQGFLSAEASQQNVHSEILPQETHTQEVPSDEMDTQVDTREVADLEMQAQESFEENKLPEEPVEEMSKALPSEELPQNAPSQEKIQPGEEQPSQEVHVQELVPEEMQQSQPHEALASDDSHMQGVTPTQDASTEGLTTQEVHVQELASEEIQSQELPFQESQPHEAPASDDSHMQDVTPTQETSAEGLSTQEVHMQEPPAEKIETEEVPAEDVDMSEVPAAEELNAKQAEPNKLVAEAAPAQESVPQEAQSEELVSQEEPAQESVPQEAQSEVSEKAPGQESVTQDAPAEASVPQEPPAHNSVAEPRDLVAEEASPQDLVAEEAPAQDLIPEDAPSQESVPEEAPSYDSVPEEAPARDSVLEDAPSQDSVPLAAVTQEMAPQEAPVPAQESASQEAAAPSQEPSPQAALAQEPASQEVPFQEPAPQEAPAQEQVLQETVAQEPAPQEIADQEPAPQEPLAQEHTPLEQPAQESVPKEQPVQESIPQEQPVQESIPQEAQAQDLLPPEAPAPGLVSEEAPAQQLPPQESSAEEMLLERVPNQGMISHGMQNQEVLTQESQSHDDPNMVQDVQHQVLPNPQDLLMLSGGNGFSDFEVYISATSNQHLKSELDQYLEESLLPRVHEFDVLGWWKLNKLKYPTLSRLAADILSIPVSTVGPESVFDTSSKKIDSYHGSLHPLTLEAIICAKDWLKNGSSPSSQAEASNAVMKLEY